MFGSYLVIEAPPGAIVFKTPKLSSSKRVFLSGRVAARVG
jgi:hypothetical protein